MLLTFKEKCSRIEKVLNECRPFSSPEVGTIPDDEGSFYYDLIIVDLSCSVGDISNFYECFSSIEGELDRSGLIVNINMHLRDARDDKVDLSFVIGVYEDMKYKDEKDAFNKILDIIEKKIREFF